MSKYCNLRHNPRLTAASDNGCLLGQKDEADDFMWHAAPRESKGPPRSLPAFVLWQLPFVC